MMMGCFGSKIHGVLCGIVASYLGYLAFQVSLLTLLEVPKRRGPLEGEMAVMEGEGATGGKSISTKAKLPQMKGQNSPKMHINGGKEAAMAFRELYIPQSSPES